MIISLTATVAPARRVFGWHRRHAAAVCVSSVVAVALMVSSCTAEGPSTTDPPSAPSDVGKSEVSSPRPSTARHVQRMVVRIPPVDTMPSTWRQVFVVPYGPAQDQFGLSRGGERGAPAYYGPEYGAPAPDGSWWFLDVAKLRLVHYDAHGDFVSAVTVPPRLLVDGDAFQWQLPHVLSDGTLVAFRLIAGADVGAMLRLRDGVLDEVPLTAMFTPTFDDGSLLYGAVADGPPLVTLDPDTGEIEPASQYHLASRAGFTLDDDFDHGVISVNAAGWSVRMKTVTPSGAVAHMGVQMRAGADGALHLYLVGQSFNRNAAQLVGYMRIDQSGTVSKLEPLPSPISSADRGSPAQLVVPPGRSEPMLVYVMADGVHVYRRTG